MAALNIFLILTVALVATNAQYGGYSCGTVPQGGAIPNAQDCTSYMVCINGVLQSQQCPSPYTFNAATQSCGMNNNCANQISDGPYNSYNPININNNVPYYPNYNYPSYGYPNYNNPSYSYPSYNNPSYYYPNSVINYPQYTYPASDTNNPWYYSSPILNALSKTVEAAKE